MKDLRGFLASMPGGLALGVRIEDGKVKIIFGKTVDWFALGKAEAIAFADMIRAKADELP